MEVQANYILVVDPRETCAVHLRILPDIDYFELL